MNIHKFVQIKYENNLPYECHMVNLVNSRRHYHNDIEIILMLSGSATANVINKEYSIKKDDLFLINNNESHEFYNCEDAKALVFHLSKQKFLLEDIITFENTFDNNDLEVKKIKSNLAKTFIDTLNSKHYASFNELFSIINSLVLYYRRDDIETKKNAKYEDRISRIVKYIDENYSERITLQELAEHENLSISYLSNFFEKNFGKTFLNYYNDVRIDNAITDLIETNESIETISFNNGYDDPRSFVNAFKKRYNCLPSTYRKNYKKTFINDNASLSKDELRQLMNRLNEFIDGPIEHNIDIKKVSPSSVLETDTIDFLQKGKYINQTFNDIIGVVSAHDLLLGDVQVMLEKAKKEIGFKYVKFHNIISDEMEIYYEDEEGNARYNYFLIDKVLDYITSINLKPIIELSYIPSMLAKYKDKYIFNGKYLASEPADLDKWSDLVDNFMDHIVSKYGEREVETWGFSIWNLPDSGPSLCGFLSDEYFLKFYLKTYNTIIDNLENAIIYSPSFSVSYKSDYKFFKDFIKFAKKNNCLPNILAITNACDIFNETDEKNTFDTNNKLQEDENYCKNSIIEFKELLKTLNIEDIKISLYTWFFTQSHRNLVSDTVFKSCYYVKNYLENIENIDSFGYWCLTDLNGETPMGVDLFHGGLGLFTRRGIEKAIYNVYLLLHKLDNEVIYQDEGIFITKSRKKIHILLYNYVHYSKAFSSGELIVKSNDRYTPFDMTKKEKFKIHLNNLNTSKIFIKEYYVGRDHGSSYDAFMRMGGLELKYDDEFDHLRRHSGYYIQMSEQNITNNSLDYENELEPLDVKLIEIKLD